MGQIKQIKGIGIIGSDDEQLIISHCERCKKQGFESILQERIYPPDEPIAHDHDLWKQCHRCGKIVPIYEAKKESKLQDFVETTDSPFDQGKTIVGLGNKRPKTPYQKQRQKLLDIIDAEKDPDIKRELRRGNIVEIIEDSLNY